MDVLQADSTGKVSRVLSSRTDAALELRRTSSVQGLALTAAHPAWAVANKLSPPELAAANTRSGSSNALQSTQHRQPHRKAQQLNRQNFDQAGVKVAEAGKMMRVTDRRWTGSLSALAPNLDVQRVRGLSQVVPKPSPGLTCCFPQKYGDQQAVQLLHLSRFSLPSCCYTGPDTQTPLAVLMQLNATDSHSVTIEVAGPLPVRLGRPSESATCIRQEQVI